MADWVMYGKDIAGGRYSITTTGASQGSSTAVLACSVDPTQVWTPGSTGSNITWYVDLGGSNTIIGVGFSNHNLSGVDAECIDASSYGGTTGSSFSWTFPDNEDFIAIGSSTLSSRYFTIRFTSAMPSGAHVGTISLLLDSAKITLTPTDAFVGLPVARDFVDSGIAGDVTVSGSEFWQVFGSQRQRLTIPLERVSQTTLNAVEDSIKTYDRWLLGAWVTDDTFGEDTALQGRGYYVRPELGQAISIQWAAPGGISTMRLPLVEFNKGAP